MISDNGVKKMSTASFSWAVPVVFSCIITTAFRKWVLFPSSFDRIRRNFYTAGPKVVVVSSVERGPGFHLARSKDGNGTHFRNDMTLIRKNNIKEKSSYTLEMLIYLTC
jgi:hypothetical protein